MGAAPAGLGNQQILKASWLDTRLGPMIAIADEQALYLLEFIDRRGLELEIERLRRKTKSAVIPGSTSPIDSLISNRFRATDAWAARPQEWCQSKDALIQASNIGFRFFAVFLAFAVVLGLFLLRPQHKTGRESAPINTNE